MIVFIFISANDLIPNNQASKYAGIPNTGIQTHKPSINAW